MHKGNQHKISKNGKTQQSCEFFRLRHASLRSLAAQATCLCASLALAIRRAVLSVAVSNLPDRWLLCELCLCEVCILRMPGKPGMSDIELPALHALLVLGPSPVKWASMVAAQPGCSALWIWSALRCTECTSARSDFEWWLSSFDWYDNMAHLCYIVYHPMLVLTVWLLLDFIGISWKGQKHFNILQHYLKISQAQFGGITSQRATERTRTHTHACWNKHTKNKMFARSCLSYEFSRSLSARVYKGFKRHVKTFFLHRSIIHIT